MNTYSLHLPDEFDLSLIYTAPDNEPKGIVQIAHGMCEHKERYIPLMEFLCENGYAVVCHDHRGHGASVKSEEDLGYIGKDGWLAWLNDMKEVMMWAKKKWPGLPYTVFGHSMGSMIARSFAIRNQDQIDSLIVCGCPSDNPAKDGGILMAKMIGRIKGWHYRPMILQNMSFGAYNKPFKDEGWSAAWVCSDPEILKAYHEDPLCQYIFTADGFLNLLLLMKDCYGKAEKVSHPCPVHFISGAEDPCRINDKALGKAVRTMKDRGYKDVTLKMYPGLRHEIHNESSARQEVWNDILSYLAPAK